jgi:hypothetical protein
MARRRKEPHEARRHRKDADQATKEFLDLLARSSGVDQKVLADEIEKRTLALLGIEAEQTSAKKGGS